MSWVQDVGTVSRPLLSLFVYFLKVVLKVTVFRHQAVFGNCKPVLFIFAMDVRPFS